MGRKYWGEQKKMMYLQDIKVQMKLLTASIFSEHSWVKQSQKDVCMLILHSTSSFRDQNSPGQGKQSRDIISEEVILMWKTLR